ncbi:hypothetical protein VP01_1067g2 [Puccinia sorghi]|uniref:Uncharacterized protein n=1 Tax=Puccinia sorghi TaxID=27349 RepID=A0A0L6VTR9_9BASI|nr:hypothetical protein VP01_1067g2 [Puccinia sorghi]
MFGRRAAKNRASQSTLHHTSHPHHPTSSNSINLFDPLTHHATGSIDPCSSKTNKTNEKESCPWDHDGVEGGESSITIILNWLSTGTNYQGWRGDTEHGKTKKLLCGEVLKVLKENGIYHGDVKGKSPIFSHADESANFFFLISYELEYWKATWTSASRLSKVSPLSICRYRDTLDPIMGSRSVTEPLFTRSSISAGHQASEDTSDRPSGNLPSNLLDVLSSAQDAEDAGHNGTPTPATTSNSSNPKKKQKKKRHSSTSQKSALGRKSQGKKNPEDFYMRSMSAT